ncbi:TonB-dependent receptor [Agriterribacter sp.]|uniref:SusC/RagA family TonB-linked outer membrane protein n=1 Tax=Agriterribacter sp. TaxID=2821509 RepID=UPI002C0F496A|nr:TonB-dependent receptor [Agriterribacter sp.]HRP57050.1 TonB-dependent receptor [Agriterribacter sp.]
MLKKLPRIFQENKKVCFSIALLFFSLFTFAQQKITVSGTVLENDAPLAGVSVLIKGTATGTTTDTQGEFTLQVTKGATLVLSFVGYENKEIKVNNTGNVGNIHMVSSTSTLGGVVVVGYGSQSKKNLASATSEVSGKDFENAVINTLDQALQGRASGVQVVNSSGEPGAQTVVRIRGNNSLSGDNEPLYVVDGFPMPPYTEALRKGQKNAYPQNGLYGINPEDIESMVVLKDAAATAIYGSRGANGVILITTKSGKAGEGKIEVRNNYSIGTIGKPLKMLTGRQYAEVMNKRNALSGWGPVFSDIDAVTTNTDWYDATTRQSSREDLSLIVSGGTSRSSYYVSGNYIKEVGSVIGASGNKKGSLRANLSSKVNNWYSIRGQFSFVRQHTDRAFSTEMRWPTGAGFLDLVRQSPTVPVDYLGFNAYGFPGNSSQFWFGNPVNELTSKIDKVKNDYSIINIENEFKILDALKLVVSLGTNQNLSRRQIFLDANTVLGQPKNGLGKNAIANTYSYNTNAYLNYDKSFSDIHRLNLTLGAEYNVQTLEETLAESENFTIPFFGINNIGSALGQEISSYRQDRKIQSGFFRANYSFKGRYVLNASVRADGASPFAENRKYGFFPTAAVAWNLDQEEFMKGVDFIYASKIRASYGETGSQAIAPYSSLQQFVNGVYPTGANNAFTLTMYPSSLGNADLSWEKTRQFNIGADVSVLDNRLSFSFDYYNKLTTDLLQPRTLPSQSGYASITDNYGTIRNRGVELSIAADIIDKKHTRLSTRFNISHNKNMLINLGDRTAPTYISIGNNLIGGVHGILVPGEEIGQFYGYKLAGLVQTDDFDDVGTPVYPYPGAAAWQVPGQIKFEDINKDGKIDIADRQVLGKSSPDFTFGWTNNFTWKNLSVNVFITGSQGNKVLNITRSLLNSGLLLWAGQVTNQTQDWYEKRWTAENPHNDPRYPGILADPPFGLTDITSAMIEDGSYVRLKSLTLLYQFPKLKAIKGLTLSVTATNLLTITNYAGFDPEVSSFRGSLLQQGIDYAGYPTQKSYTFGISCNF